MAKTTKILAESIQAAPEADRLEGFPHPRENSVLYGHEQAETELLDTFRCRHMPHAWLLTGPEGIGKATLAYRLAKFLFAAHDDEDLVERNSLAVNTDLRAFRQVVAQSHPNLLAIKRPWNTKTKRFAAAIPVDEVRKLNSFLGMTAGDNCWRVVVVDRADELNLHSANALLKSVEEPPGNCLFILISATPGRLLPTIRSRCRTLHLDPPCHKVMIEAVQNIWQQTGESAPNLSEMELAVLLAEGSVRRALELLSGKGLELYETLIGIFEKLPDLPCKDVYGLAERLSPANAERDFEMFFSLLSALIRRLVRVSVGQETALPQESEIEENFAIRTALAQWAELWETINRAKAEAQELNLDRKLLILETFQRLQAAARIGSQSKP